MDKPQQGDLIVVRSYGNVALVRRLWELTSNAAYIHDERQFELRKSGRLFHAPVGFPIEDTYYLPEGASPSKVEGETPDWSALKPLVT